LFASLLFSGPTAHAKSETLNLAGKKAKVVGKAAIYGAGGGLIVGMASQVFKKKAKNIFVFGSLGLYAGILLGVYVISTHSGPAPYEGPDTYEDYGDFSRRVIAPAGLVAFERDPFAANAVSMNVVQLEF
jgi:hypothetical protein